MLSLKSFRQLLDQTTNFGELIPHLQEILSGDINIEFGNSLLHTLSLFSENELTFEEWEELYNTLKSKLKVSEFTETTYYSIIRLFSSHFGFQLVETKGGFTSVITDLLQELEKSSFHFRRRTFFPIIQRCYLSQNKNLALHSYLNCQVRKIPLEPVDMACLMGTLDSEFQHTLWLDIVNNQTQFDSKSLGIMNKVFPHSREVDITQIIDIIPPFSLSKLEQTQVLNNLRTHVDSITRTRRALLKTYDKFISELKKMKYSVVIDGANVGRFNQGVKSQGELNFNQIDLMVKIIKSKGHQVLLCLNENHLRKVNSKYESNLTYLRNNCKILETPRGLDDDLFWLYASIYKPNCLLLTNDELRNHIHAINGSFLKWKEYRRITYCINKLKSAEAPIIKVNYPLKYEVKPYWCRHQNMVFIPENWEKWHQFPVE